MLQILARPGLSAMGGKETVMTVAVSFWPTKPQTFAIASGCRPRLGWDDPRPFPCGSQLTRLGSSPTSDENTPLWMRIAIEQDVGTTLG